MPLREAIVESCRTRLRPILMTTTAIIAGLIPTSLGIGIGGTGRAAIAVTIIGGQSLCLFLTLLLVPVAYVKFDALERRRGRTREGLAGEGLGRDGRPASSGGGIPTRLIGSRALGAEDGWVLGAGCWVLGAGAGCWVLGARCWCCGAVDEMKRHLVRRSHAKTAGRTAEGTGRTEQAAKSLTRSPANQVIERATRRMPNGSL